MVRTHAFIFLMLHLSSIISENRLVDLLHAPFQSMESHMTESCALPDWAVLFTQTIGPCKPHWTAIPQDLVIKTLEPLKFTAFSDPTFDWWHVLKLFWVSIFGFAWIQSIWWTTFKWLLAPLCYLYLECGIERYLTGEIAQLPSSALPRCPDMVSHIYGTTSTRYTAALHCTMD
jgi:hypothetical protein